MTDNKCRICKTNKSAKAGAQNRTPSSRMPAINAGICMKCYELYLDAKFILKHEKNISQELVNYCNSKIESFNNRSTT